MFIELGDIDHVGVLFLGFGAVYGLSRVDAVKLRFIPVAYGHLW